MRSRDWKVRLQAACLLLLAGILTAPWAAAASLAQQFNQGAEQHGRNVSTFRDTVEGWPLAVYTPWNAAKARAQEATLAAMQKKYRDRPPANEAELAELTESIAIFLRYAKLYEEFHAPDTVLVPANGIASVDINSYCLDAGRPSPPTDEPLKLVRYSNLFPASVVPV